MQGFKSLPSRGARVEIRFVLGHGEHNIDFVAPLAGSEG